MDLNQFKSENKVMSEGYWKLWNSEVQAKIDRDIEANRKADASVKLENIPEGAEVKVEQTAHSFIFGAHIFNFDQLGTDERNTRYKDMYGTLFNSATIAFYWKKLEMEEGKPRFKGEYRDTAEYWNTVKEPKKEPHWRRPATDPVVEFCESKGIRLHGHTLTWGNSRWHHPEWLQAKMPSPYREMFPAECKDSENMTSRLFEDFTPAQLEQMFPEFARELHHQMMNRIVDIAMYYKGRLHSWDVVNESAGDFRDGKMNPEDNICKSWYGLMPGDYTYRSFKVADAMFPKDILLNINDFNMGKEYAEQTNDLLERGCKIDIMGAQMHLFDPQDCLDIADGKAKGKAAEQSPDEIWSMLDRIGQTGLPIHMSEITITAPNNDERGQAIQAIITRNLYRLWFSAKQVMGITWWNTVDDCGAPGEPSVSGIFSRDMQPKPAYHVMNDLINNEWKTRTTVKSGKDGLVEFRGFRGGYKLSWKDAAGKECSKEFDLE